MMKLGLCLVPLLFGLFGCSGRVLDLDHGASPDASQSDPSLPSSVDDVVGVWADDTRLFWVAAAKFQSCLKTDCKHTTITYGTDVFDRPSVTGGRVYWQSLDNTLFACPAEGCAASPLKIIQDHLAFAIDADGNYFYWSSAFDIYRCPAGGCDAVPEVVASNARADVLLIDQTSAYWLDSSGILSAPVDGSETPKLLVPLTEKGTLAVSAGYLYWTAGGQVFRCSTAGCGASPPRLLVTADSKISAVKLDDNTMYWLAANAIHSCELPECEEPQLFTPPAVAKLFDPWQTESFAVDATDVYWIEAKTAPNDLQGAAIRRTPK